MIEKNFAFVDFCVPSVADGNQRHALLYQLHDCKSIRIPIACMCMCIVGYRSIVWNFSADKVPSIQEVCIVMIRSHGVQ